MSDISSPMTSRPWGEQGRGGNAPGMKDGVALGAPKGDEISTPLNNPWGKMTANTPPSTAGGPVGMQVTEDVQDIAGKHNRFPSGTGSRA